MSKHRHKKHGGKVFYEGGASNVAHEAEEKKHGGAAKHHGKEHHHHLEKVHGKKHGGRLDKRARGGRIGADKSPFSSATIDTHGPHSKSGV